MRRDFTVGVETEPWNMAAELDAGGLDLVSRLLPHEQPTSDAAHQNRELQPVRADPAPRPARRAGGPSSSYRTLPRDRVIGRRGPNSSQPPALPWPMRIAGP